MGHGVLWSMQPQCTVIYLSDFLDWRLGNLMSQLMFVRTVRSLAQWPVVADGYSLPDWNLAGPGFGAQRRARLNIGAGMTKASSVARVIDRYRPSRINLYGLPFQVENYLKPAEYLELFPYSPRSTELTEGYIVAHIRGGDVARPSHPGMGPIPINYYRYLADQTGLPLLFVGEIDGSPYSRALRAAFPKSTFLCGGSAFDDFQTIRSAQYIALGISTFSWIAAYLSNAREIHVPVAGVFDPRLRPDHDLLPSHDPRYVFHDISPKAWDDRYADIYATIDDFRPMTNEVVLNLRQIATRAVANQWRRIRFGMEWRLALDRAIRLF